MGGFRETSRDGQMDRWTDRYCQMHATHLDETATLTRFCSTLMGKAHRFLLPCDIDPSPEAAPSRRNKAIP